MLSNKNINPEYLKPDGDLDVEKLKAHLVKGLKEDMAKIKANGGVPTKEMIKEQEDALGYGKWWSRD